MTGIVIVGGGMTGGTAARYLRAEGYEGPITIVAAEPHFPYQRPPLSKGYLQGSEGLDEVYLKPDDWYRDKNIAVIVNTSVDAIMPRDRQLSLSDGSTLHYEQLLLATGARPRRLELDGTDLEGVYQLRTVDDSDALREVLQAGDRRVVLVGSGWIGLEVAASATQMGNRVLVVDHGPVPLGRALGETLGKEFQKMHEERGVEFLLNANVQAITGEDGKVTGVQVDGEQYPADVVIVGVGAIPNTELAEKCGIDVEDGILTDVGLRTNLPDIFAAGDVANTFNQTLGTRMRSEHWMNALTGGKEAARALVGQPVVYDPIPYFYTDQYDLGMELSGYPPLMNEAKLVIRGDLSAREYIAFWVGSDNQVVGGMNVNIWDVNPAIQALIRSGKPVSVELLQDPDVPLDAVYA